MSTTQTTSEQAAGAPTAAAVAQKIEVVVIPVSDVDRAKQFYTSLGWRLDADFTNNDDWRVVQLTPPGSPCSVFLGKGLTNAAPGSVQGTFLVVDDVQQARAELAKRGVEVSDVFHFDHDIIRVAGTKGRLPGPDPDRSYFSFATFSDPDGNSWVLQKVTARFPGRGESSLDVARLTALLRETEEHHGEYQASSPKHHWSDWYAAYMVARRKGRRPTRPPPPAGRTWGTCNPMKADIVPVFVFPDYHSVVPDLRGELYIVRLSPTLAVALTASSPADAMSSAPVRFRMSFARVISSDVAQWTDSRTPPSFTRPS